MVCGSMHFAPLLDVRLANSYTWVPPAGAAVCCPRDTSPAGIGAAAAPTERAVDASAAPQKDTTNDNKTIET
eukprot:991230-Amphidinium_carterae.1